MAKRSIFRDADSGDPYAALGLAYMYHHGKNIDPDPDMALKWYIRSAEAGCSRSKWELTKIYRDGTIAKRNEALYIQHLMSAAEAEVPEAKTELGIVYLRGAYVDRDVIHAFKLISSAASQGYIIAQFMAGYMHGKGFGTERDVSKQDELYTEVKFRGDGELFYGIGRNFEYGLFNIDTDLFEAARWYRFGAEMGHEKCMICWQSVTATLDGGKQETLEERESKLMETEVEEEKILRDQALNTADRYLEKGEEENAFLNYKRAAELGNPVAIFTLAMMYREGIYVKRNDKTAMDLIFNASIAGSEDAQYLIGDMYEEGKILKKDANEAIRYFTTAAANGYLAAYYRLGKYMDNPEIHVRNSAVIVR